MRTRGIIRTWALVIAPLAALGLFSLLLSQQLPFEIAVTAGVTLWCAVWWIFEPVPIPMTSMLPLTLFPLLGVLTPEQVGQAYGHWLILLLMGGFMISAAMAKSGVHRRIALQMLRLFGAGNAFRLVLGFMVTAAVLSMWVSNTATTLMLLPVALAIIESAQARLAVPLLLGIAYAASVGGMGTPIGTTPNLIFISVYAGQFGTETSFVEWMSWGLPIVFVLVPLMALWLTRSLRLTRGIELPDPGHWRRDEVRVMVIFALTAICWITRTAPFGGWKALLGLQYANDASVALLSVILLSAVPDTRGGRLLDWDSAKTIPWGMLLLFGGGLAIAAAFAESGLADLIASKLTLLADFPVWLLLALVCLSVTFMTEVTSNTATASLLIPLLAAAATAAGLDPHLLMIPAAMSASCAFMLPVATAPNAIIYGSGRLTVATMVREGFVLNLVGVVVISGLSYLYFG